MTPGDQDDIVEGGGSGPDRERSGPLSRVPITLRRGALILALVLAASLWVRPYLSAGSGRPAFVAPTPTGTPTSLELRSATDAPVSVAALLEARARSHAHAEHAAQVRAAPQTYRIAAEQAHALGKHHLPAEYYLALAYNRTLYGALITAPWNRSEAPRGPLQWDLDRFRSVTARGHQDATDPLDAFLAVDAALSGAYAASTDDAFRLSIRLGASNDEARADAEAFDILIGRPG